MRSLTAILILILIPLQIISANIVNAQATKPVVILGFSDGYKSQYTIGYPYLKTYGYKAFIMVIANLVNDTTPFEDQDLMSWTEINTLEAKGYNVISHGYNHVHMANTTIEQILLETSASQSLIKNETGTKPYIFAVPYGSRNSTVNGYIDDYYPITLDDYYNCAWHPEPIFPYTNHSAIDYQYIPATGFVGQNSTGDNSALIKATLTQHLDWLVGNGSGYAYIPCWHTIFADVADCRDTPYNDIDQATFEDCIDIIHEYETVGKNITVSTINSLFSSHLMSIQTHDAIMEILPSCISIVMLAVAIGFITKARFS